MRIQRGGPRSGYDEEAIASGKDHQRDSFNREYCEEIKRL
jgi:hypothetical protein